MSTAGLIFCQDRNKGLRKCTLSKQSPKKVGNAKGNNKGIKSLPAPNTLSSTTSRTKPKIRDNIVIALTITVDRHNAIALTYGLSLKSVIVMKVKIDFVVKS